MPEYHVRLAARAVLRRAVAVTAANRAEARRLALARADAGPSAIWAHGAREEEVTVRPGDLERIAVVGVEDL